MSQKHRFINDGRSPIPMGSDARYACVCGKTGTREAIDQHVAERAAADRAETDHQEAWRSLTSPAVPIDADIGGDTKAHYLPMQPREPAAPMFAELPTPPELPPPPPPPPTPCPHCQLGDPIAELPEIFAWSCGHWIRRKVQPIAEAFQDMLRSAYQAGVAAATSGESFESWYQREVLR